MIGCAIRLSHIPDLRATYREETKRRLQQHFQVEPFAMSNNGITFESVLNSVRPLVENTALRRTMSAVDMFLAKNKTHDYAKLKLGTCVLQGHDSVVLEDITLIRKKLGVNTLELMQLMIDPLIDEMKILDKGLREHGVPGSCKVNLLYCRSMEIVERSPLSATACKALHTLLMTIAICASIQRGFNSRYVETAAPRSVIQYGAVIAYNFLRCAGVKPFFFPSGDAVANHWAEVDAERDLGRGGVENLDDFVLPEEDHRPSRDPNVIYSRIRRYNGRIPQYITDSVTRALAILGNPRDNSLARKIPMFLV